MAIIGHGSFTIPPRRLPAVPYSSPWSCSPSNARWQIVCTYKTRGWRQVDAGYGNRDLTAEACSNLAEYASCVRGACWTDGCSANLTTTAYDFTTIYRGQFLSSDSPIVRSSQLSQCVPGWRARGSRRRRQTECECQPHSSAASLISLILANPNHSHPRLPRDEITRPCTARWEISSSL